MLPFEWNNELSSLLEGFGEVQLVVHSSWRERFSLDEIREFLGPLGERLIGAVEVGPKADAIETFLAAHPDVLDAVILDDEPASFSADFPVPVVVCNPRWGISCAATKEKLRAWLSRGNDF